MNMMISEEHIMARIIGSWHSLLKLTLQFKEGVVYGDNLEFSIGTFNALRGAKGKQSLSIIFAVVRRLQACQANICCDLLLTCVILSKPFQVLFVQALAWKSLNLSC